MSARPGAEPRRDQVPQLAPDCDPARLRLSPAEGFLLSRIDGATRWSLLREMGGLPPVEVDHCLERWLREGVVVVAESHKPAGPAPGPAAVAAAPEAPEPELDPSLDIPVEVQSEILGFERRLAQPHHELLDVALDAPVALIKKSYFKLSKKFHPDRYFRRNLGPFAPRLERIFKKVLEAYELLSDPTTRAELQRSLAAAPPPAPALAAEPVSGGKPQAARRTAESLSLLAQHRRLLEQRRRKAKTLFESGMSAFRQGRWLEAARGVRLAIAFDPRNEAIRESFSDVQRKVHEEQAKLLTKQADDARDLRDWAEAERLYEEAFHYRPFDAALAANIARLAWQASGDLRKAKEFAASACEIEPEHAPYRLLLGRVYKAADLKANARREFEKALRLDPLGGEAKIELKSL